MFGKTCSVIVSKDNFRIKSVSVYVSCNMGNKRAEFIKKLNKHLSGNIKVILLRDFNTINSELNRNDKFILNNSKVKDNN